MAQDHSAGDDFVRVLVVDDSSTMRRLIRIGIERDPRIRVVAEAANAREARDAVKSLAPDVMTLDVEMPGMTGIEFLERLMRARPMPVIMLSSLTRKGSEAALQALANGAVDCVEKPRFGAAQETFATLGEKILVAAGARVRRHRASAAMIEPARQGWRWNGRWILIGSSTGGVEALETILRSFPQDCPPTLITQHMPGPFLVSFASRLNAANAPSVRIAADGDRPSQGEVYIAPGGETHLMLAPDGETVRLVPGPKRSGHRPSVDELFASALPYASRTVAAILTGMGRDGADGMAALRRAGAHCIGQDEETSVVYGMPRVAYELGGVETQVPLGKIGVHLLEMAGA